MLTGPKLIQTLKETKVCAAERRKGNAKQFTTNTAGQVTNHGEDDIY
jgi:hypothetical protein